MANCSVYLATTSIHVYTYCHRHRYQLQGNVLIMIYISTVNENLGKNLYIIITISIPGLDGPRVINQWMASDEFPFPEFFLQVLAFNTNICVNNFHCRDTSFSLYLYRTRVSHNLFSLAGHLTFCPLLRLPKPMYLV